MSEKLNEKQYRFLASLEIVRRELVVFHYSADRLFKRNINLIWVEQLSHDMESAEILEAFGGRFFRVARHNRR